MSTSRLPTRIRKIRGVLPQRRFAKLLGISQSRLSRWEKGDGEPSVSTVKVLASIAQCSLDSLLDDSVDDSFLDENLFVLHEVE
jgi:transcriptional regulator with XRE-family HTH domain